MGRTTRLRTRRAAACAAAGALLASIAASCSDDVADRTVETTVVADAETDPDGSVPTAVDDGVLTVGVVLPLTGPGSEIGTVMNEAIELARRQTSDGGIRIQEVVTVVVDETTLEGDITPSLDEIFAEEVDAVIGPASSRFAARLLPITISAGVLTCSPTASALSLDDFPDAGSLFIRTIPSDTLQATALALQLDSTGGDIVIAYVDDAYGRPLMELVQRRLLAFDDRLVVTVPFDPRVSDYGSIADEIVEAGTSTIGIIGDPEAGPRLVQSLAETIDPEVVTSIWMNDAMRVPATANAYRRLADSPILALMSGVSPRSSVASQVNPGPDAANLPDDGRFFAANAYDCLNVIALAADQADPPDGAGSAGTVDGRAMADQVVQVTNGGTSCASFPQCIDQLRRNRGIDYDGPSAGLDIGGDGDPSVGFFDVYSFDERGLDVTLDRDPIRVTDQS